MPFSFWSTFLFLLADIDCEIKDTEVNQQIEEIRLILEQQKIEDTAIYSVMDKVTKIKSIYVNKLIQVGFLN